MYDPVTDRVDGLACQLLKGPLHGLLVMPHNTLAPLRSSVTDCQTKAGPASDAFHFSADHHA